MPDTDGIALLKEWVSQDLLSMPVIMMSGHGTIETAVEATRIGAVDFLEKPIALHRLLDTIAKAIRQGVTPVTQKSSPLNGETAAETAPSFPLPLDLPLREARDYFDTLYFNYHMHRENGNITHVAQKAGLERTHLYRKLKQLGIKISKKASEDK
jgi:DNA-binding NtrC family response regulator